MVYVVAGDDRVFLVGIAFISSWNREYVSVSFRLLQIFIAKRYFRPDSNRNTNW